MNKIDPEIKYPPLNTLVKIFFRQGPGKGWALCFDVGFWDGEDWCRISISPNGNASNCNQGRVEGWEELFK